MIGKSTLRWIAAGWLLATAWAPSLAMAQGRPSHAEPRAKQSVVEARNKMVDEEIVGAGVKNPRVIEAMRKTPRHEFVPLNLRANSYFDMALPIGEGQTISPPFVVAYMTESLDPRPTDKVLEIGTGSGYQAAVLSGLGARGLFDRDRRPVGPEGRQGPSAAPLRQRPYQGGRRLSGMARTCAVRQDHRDLLAGKGASGAGGTAQGRWTHRHPRGAALSTDPVPAQEDRREHGSGEIVADAVRAHDGRGGSAPEGETRSDRTGHRERRFRGDLRGPAATDRLALRAPTRCDRQCRRTLGQELRDLPQHGAGTRWRRHCRPSRSTDEWSRRWNSRPMSDSATCGPARRPNNCPWSASSSTTRIASWSAKKSLAPGEATSLGSWRRNRSRYQAGRREAIMRIGMFGAVGDFSIDDVQVKVVRKNE